MFVLAEIYKEHSFAPFSNLNLPFFANGRLETSSNCSSGPCVSPEEHSRSRATNWPRISGPAPLSCIDSRASVRSSPRSARRTRICFSERRGSRETFRTGSPGSPKSPDCSFCRRFRLRVFVCVGAGGGKKNYRLMCKGSQRNSELGMKGQTDLVEG